MKFQVTILLLASLAAFANAAVSSTTAATMTAKKGDDSVIDTNVGVTVGDVIKFTCTVADAGATHFKLYRGASTLIATSAVGSAGAAGAALPPHDYTTVADDVSGSTGTTSYSCAAMEGTTEGAKSSPATTVKVNAVTTTPAPTTTTMAGGSGGGNGAGSNSPVMAVFLLTIAAMCF